MKNKCKKSKLLLLLLMMSLITTSILPVQAMSKDDIEMGTEYRIQEGYIVDREGHKYSNFCDSSGKEIPLEEALNVLNGGIIEETCNINNSNSRGVVPVEELVTIKTLVNKYVGGAKKVTQDVRALEGPMAVEYTVSTTSSSSITGNLSATAKNLIFNKVDVSVSVAITGTKADTETVSVKGTIKTGNTGAIYFKPYYVKATGTYRNEDNSLSSFTAKYPLLLENNSRMADGMFYLEQW